MPKERVSYSMRMPNLDLVPNKPRKGKSDLKLLPNLTRGKNLKRDDYYFTFYIFCATLAFMLLSLISPKYNQVGRMGRQRDILGKDMLSYERLERVILALCEGDGCLWIVENSFLEKENCVNCELMILV
jgi:hypothetical protein